MTEKSYVWDGTVTGDSTLAPYYADIFNKYMHMHIYGGGDVALVVPGYLDDLESLLSSNSITIKSGAAFLKNFLYRQTDTVSFGFTTVADGYYRIDSVVLKVDYLAQTVRLVLKAGSAQTTPEVAFTNRASLIQTEGYIWEEVLYYVFQDKYNNYLYTSDQRKFIINFETQLKITPIVNSEFLAYSPVGAAQGPEGWELSSGSISADITASFNQARGRNFTFGVGGGAIRQTFPVSIESNKVFTLAHVTGAYTILRMRGELLTGEYTDWYSSISLGASGTLYTLTHKFTEEIQTVQIEIYTYDPRSYFGQALFIEAYHTGFSHLLIDRLISFQDEETDANWSATAKSTGNTTILLSANFNTNIKSGTKAVLLRLEANDSASAAGAGLLLGASSLKTEGQLLLDGVTNDYKRSQTMLVPVSYQIFTTSSGTAQFILNVVASGAGTLDATAEIAGIIT